MKAQLLCIVPRDLRVLLIPNYNIVIIQNALLKTTELTILFFFLLGEGFNRQQLCECGTPSATFQTSP